MKVRCIANQITPAQIERYGVQRTTPQKYNLTLKKEYVVLGLTALASDSVYGAGVTIDVLDDFARWSIQPLFLFEVVDPRPSRYWIAKKISEAELALWPESFFGDCYHDRLTDGAVAEVSDFKRVCTLLENEFADESLPS